MDRPGPALYRLIRPLLFRLDAERAHRLTLNALDAVHRARALSTLFAPPLEASAPVSLLGLRFPNRVGLAAGLDKNGEHVDALAALGFGFLEIGTVTPKAQPGNERPRLFRLPEARAIINRFGFNNDGLDAVLDRVARSELVDAGRPHAVLGINIGKNATTPLERAADDYCQGLRRACALADYVAINVSSPNTANLRQLQDDEPLERLLAAIDRERARLHREGARVVPVLLKIAPDLDEAQIEAICGALKRHGFDGVIATNTTVSRHGVESLRNGTQTGGLSGAPLNATADRIVRALRQRLPTGFPIIGVGGIGSAAQALARRKAGADLVQIYTGLVYAGPGLVRDCAAALRDRPR